VNATGTFNVYAAAARAGIRRVVTASSINAYGSQFGLSPMPVTALPLVEEDPGRTTDAYSFSKQVVEATARYAWRRDGIGGTCLRLPGVVPPHFSARETVLPHAERCRASLAALRALPPGERAARVASWVAHRDAWRVHAPWNDPVAPRGYEWPDPLAEGWPDFFTRIDERDAAQAVEKSLDAPYEGMHVLNVNDSCTVTGVPSLELAALFFPGARLRVDRLQSTASLVSIDAARALIGFEPEHSVGRWFAES
jgi:nucleoside-diphosphate-sugar epimerase